MISKIKSLLRKILPYKVIGCYHYCFALLASLVYGLPSRKMIVIGVTGTKGKTSAINFIWSVLNQNGIKTGIITTANVRIGNEEIINPFHMTMPGRFVIQKFLRRMVSGGCECAIVETTSQGIQQFRHIGIEFDIAIFTNLTPEHIDAHKTFDNYKMMKGKLFACLGSSKKKMFKGNLFPKTIIANADSEYAPYFLGFDADNKESFSIDLQSQNEAENILPNKNGVEFELHTHKYSLSIPGTFNVYNALPAIIVGKLFGIGHERVKNALAHLNLIPGRMEEIKEGQNFRVFVDYAHEKQSMTYATETANILRGENGRSIILLGAEGGGRDKGKRAVMGEIVGRLADVAVVSNVDPYEDDAVPILEDIAKATEAAGKVREENLFVIEDRREGIQKSLKLAREGDVVMITGKGAEQSMIIGGASSPWDDRTVVREELQKVMRGE
ncbi:MAG: UDP-N-acetylmuramyl-tripeptide synthetase [Patescibacteria group bacterium]